MREIYERNVSDYSICIIIMQIDGNDYALFDG